MQTINLTDGGILRYIEAFVPSELADRYFAELRDHCAWEQKPGIFGHMQPRLIASYGGSLSSSSSMDSRNFLLWSGRHSLGRDGGLPHVAASPGM
jgi:hypothetical protein